MRFPSLIAYEALLRASGLSAIGSETVGAQCSCGTTQPPHNVGEAYRHQRRRGTT